jgi:ligand-binding sensor domain-containing protein/signal transduction histidine kinase
MTWAWRAGAAVASSQPEYMIEAWQIEDGLPQSSVTSIAQTPDGYLWLATYNGLVRFDGVRFTVFDTSNLPGLPGNRLLHLSADQEGGLWIITEYQDVARLKDGQCRVFTAADGIPASETKWLGGDGQGGWWLGGAKAGLWRWQAGRFLPVAIPPETATQPWGTLVTDQAGRPWFHHRGRMFGFEEDRLVSLTGPTGQDDAWAKNVCASRDGGLWVLTPKGLRKRLAGEWRPEVWPGPDCKSLVVDFQEDFAGNLWVATYNNGLFRFNAAEGWQRLGVEAGLTTVNLRSLYCDREKNVWVGTDGGGLLRIRPRPWKMITRRDGLGIDAVHSLCQDQQGRIWFAGGTTKPYWLERGKVSVAIPAPQSDVLDGVWSVIPARDGSMWIGTYRGNVFQYRDGILHRYGSSEGMLAGSMRALLEDRQGRIWAGGFGGLSRIDRGQVTHYSRADGLSSERVWALAEGAAGCLYVGTAGGGLNMWQDGRFTIHGKGQGLPDDYIRSLYVDGEGVLWIGTKFGGLSRFKEGQFFNYAVKGGIPVRGIGPMLEDDAGSLWMASDAGFLRVSRRELNEFAAGARKGVSVVAFDQSDGVATIEMGGIQPACLKARDGTLWFGTAKGATFVNPQALPVNPLPPPVLIEEVRIDENPIVIDLSPAGSSRRSGAGEVGGTPATANQEAGDAERGPSSSGRKPDARRPAPVITVLPHQHWLEFRFTALSFAASSKVRFRYQMEGFDPGWVDGGSRRSTVYTRLPSGRYRFRVTACNDSGVWNETGASLAVVVVPVFHQTWWFRLLVLAAVGGAGFLLFHLRIRRLKQLAHLRGRIAGDLHDEIGSNLGGIILLSELTQRTASLPPDARTSLQEINATAQRTASSLRDIGWFLNPDFDTLTDMMARMRKFAATLLGGLECEFAVSGLESAQNLPLEFRRNVFFAYKEILHNIVRHAGATRVDIRLERVGHRLALSVRDNGSGFTPTAATSGHGLRSLRQRMADLGGQLEVESAPGQGTSVRLTVPLP